MTRIMFPFLLLVALAAVAMGVLNTRNVFGVPAAASAFFNLGLDRRRARAVRLARARLHRERLRRRHAAVATRRGGARHHRHGRSGR